MFELSLIKISLSVIVHLLSSFSLAFLCYQSYQVIKGDTTVRVKMGFYKHNVQLLINSKPKVCAYLLTASESQLLAVFFRFL